MDKGGSQHAGYRKGKLEKTKQDIMDRLTSGNLPSELEEELRAAVKRVQEQLKNQNESVFAIAVELNNLSSINEAIGKVGSSAVEKRQERIKRGIQHIL